MTDDRFPAGPRLTSRRPSVAGRRLRAALLCVLLGLPSPSAPVLLPGALAGGLALTGLPSEAQARAGSSSSRSSGGYSRPSGSSRTPSFSAPRPSAGSSGSGGYRRPSLSPPSTYSPGPSYQSPADRELSRRQSGEALDRFRQPPPMTVPSAPRSSPVPASPPPAARRHGQADEWAGSRSGGGWGGGWGGYPGGGGWGRGGWGGGWAGGWRPPGYAYNTPSRFGIWDGLFLWFLLDNLSRAGSADFFHNHRDDPGYAQWRAEAERRAQDDAELRRKLDDLDRQLAERKDQPRDPNYLPPDIPRDAAVAEDRAGGSGGMGIGLVLAVLLIGGGVAMVLWMRSRRRSQTPAGPAPTSSPASMAGRILRNAVGGEPYKPSLFRVGMTLTADPTPFILAAGVTKVAAPDTGSSGLVSVEAVGTLTAGGTTLHRLYLPGGGFFQLHLGADGKPDECRYFSPLDEVSPASAEEWGFWLDLAEGMIGWPEFQTKDGKLYARQWAPGQSRVQPYGFAEQRQEAGGEQTRRLQSMLYAASTGAAPPAPPTEYILVTAVEQAGQAWVEVHAGIDVNPAILSLA